MIRKRNKYSFPPLNELNLHFPHPYLLINIGALKQYLRDLPEPLLTFKLHDEFIQAGR